MGRSRCARAAFAAVLLAAVPAGADEGAVSITDYPDYRTALADRSRGPAQRVSFHDLWNQPDRHRGLRVEMTGRIDRRFRQPAVGEFPALVEAWIRDEQGNPICLVFPNHNERRALGERVRFTGTFLRLVHYRSGDGDRLAPLIVGPAAPVADETEVPVSSSSGAVDWAVGLGLLALVVVVLGAQHLRARPRRRHVIGPAPNFLEPNDGPLPAEEEPGGEADVH